MTDARDSTPLLVFPRRPLKEAREVPGTRAERWVPPPRDLHAHDARARTLRFPRTASEAPSAALPMPSRGAPLSSSHETLRVFASPESKPRAPRPFSSKVRICTRFRVTKKRERSINRVNSPKFTFEKSWISKPLGEHFEFREPPSRTVPSRGRRLERSPRRARCRDEACARGRPCPTKRTT